MSEFKGTKGKWIFKKPIGSTGFYYIDNKNTNMGSVATCYSGSFDNEYEAGANAKLIACAPEMLEILEVFSKINPIAREHISEKLFKDIDKLIKKATE